MDADLDSSFLRRLKLIAQHLNVLQILQSGVGAGGDRDGWTSQAAPDFVVLAA